MAPQTPHVLLNLQSVDRRETIPSLNIVLFQEPN